MKKFLLVVVAIPVLLLIGLGVAVATFDPNKYRPQLVELLSEKTGRAVKLGGPITLGMSLDGVTLGIQDASIGNPAWASRKELASIGRFDMGVALLPLLDHKLVLKSLKISKADIQVESNAAGEANWEIKSKEPASAPQAATDKHSTAAQPISVDVGSISVEDSRLAMRDAAGKATVFKIEKLSIAHDSSGFTLNLTSNFNGTTVDAKAKLAIADLMNIKIVPLDADVTYANYHLTASGKVNVADKVLELTSYKASAGASDVHGVMKASWGGAKPSVAATVLSAKLNPADFKPEAAKAEAATAAMESGAPPRVFSTSPLALDGLKAVNAALDIKLDEVALAASSVTNVDGKINLTNGVLNVSFPAIHLVQSVLALKTELNAASSPSKLEVNFTAPDVDTVSLMELMGMKPFLAAKADARMNISSYGNSLHELASHADGAFTVFSEGGKLVTSAMDGTLAQLITLGAGNDAVALNCLAARFNIKDGVVSDNGVLADTTTSTVQVKGGMNLGEETLDLTAAVFAKAGKVSALVPPVHVHGGFTHPAYSVDAGNLAQNVMGLLSGKGAKTSTVPSMLVPPTPQNACVYTLDHPAAAPVATTTAPAQKLNAKDAVKNLGGNLLKGLLGH